MLALINLQRNANSFFSSFLFETRLASNFLCSQYRRGWPWPSAFLTSIFLCLLRGMCTNLVMWGWEGTQGIEHARQALCPLNHSSIIAFQPQWGAVVWLRVEPLLRILQWGARDLARSQRTGVQITCAIETNLSCMRPCLMKAKATTPPSTNKNRKKQMNFQSLWQIRLLLSFLLSLLDLCWEPNCDVSTWEGCAQMCKTQLTTSFFPGAAPLCLQEAFCPGAGLQAERALPRELQCSSPGYLPGRQWLLDRTHLFLRDWLL